MEWLILGIIILLTIINVPIGFALSISAIILLLWKATASLSIVPLNLFSGASSFPLLAIPLFILAGGLMETSGISLRLVNMANSLVGFIRGGLAMVTVVATMIQGEEKGSGVLFLTSQSEKVSFRSLCDGEVWVDRRRIEPTDGPATAAPYQPPVPACRTARR